MKCGTRNYVNKSDLKHKKSILFTYIYLFLFEQKWKYTLLFIDFHYLYYLYVIKQN